MLECLGVIGDVAGSQGDELKPIPLVHPLAVQSAQAVELGVGVVRVEIEPGQARQGELGGCGVQVPDARPAPGSSR